jgi:hypothetical protein
MWDRNILPSFVCRARSWVHFGTSVHLERTIDLILSCLIAINYANSSGFFSQVWKAVQPLILGENYTVFLQSGRKKISCNFNFLGKLHDFKELF